MLSQERAGTGWPGWDTTEVDLPTMYVVEAENRRKTKYFVGFCIVLLRNDSSTIMAPP